MDTINDVINEFSNFLDQSFESILDISKKIEKEQSNIFLADMIENGYLQFMWEMSVESRICKSNDYLSPYGDGADFYPLSSRVTQPDKKATKEIIVYVTSSFELLNSVLVCNKCYDFIKFISYDGYHYNQSPPFEYVLCENEIGEKKIFSRKDIRFVLSDIQNTD